jgi:hypothetical protein
VSVNKSDVVKSLKELLVKAEKGDVSNFIFIGLDGDGDAMQISCFAGTCGEFFKITGAAHVFLNGMTADFSSKTGVISDDSRKHFEEVMKA